VTSRPAERPELAEPEASLLGRLKDIEAVTDAALSRLDGQSLLNELLERVKAVLDADTAAVLLLDRAAGELVATAASGTEEEVTQGVRVPLGAGFAGRIAASAQPLAVDRVDHDTVSNQLLVDRGIKSLLGVPLLAGGQVIGVLHVGSLSGRPFTAEDADLLQLAADRAASALQSMMAQDDRMAAVALHRSLRPPALPRVPGVDLAARYVTGSGYVGGDWYDVFLLPGGELGMVIGDVAGSGLPAAVIMGRMRSALRAYVLETHDSGSALRMLDRKIQYFEQDAMATVQYSVYQPSTGRLVMSSAGHLPPVLAVPGREPRVLEFDVDVPIGVADDPPRHSTVIDLPPGALLCCYTDGLVERRGEILDTGIGVLAQAMGEAATAARGMSQPVRISEMACTAVMRTMLSRAPARDDVALLMLYRTP
jgi:sigma-B regulation protein RsbU (phosphoserine phosphatase)